jgi:transcriptional regulator with XRE-family HTH domain
MASGHSIRRAVLMGAASRKRPRHLAGKLLEIRNRLDLSQDGMVRALGLAEEITRNYVSGYERGTREPEMHVLLRYARAAGVCVDLLSDDKRDLPKRLPGPAGYERHLPPPAAKHKNSARK